MMGCASHSQDMQLASQPASQPVSQTASEQASKLASMDANLGNQKLLLFKFSSECLVITYQY